MESNEAEEAGRTRQQPSQRIPLLRPIIFVSHIHQDAHIAAVLENTIRTTLLGGLDLFSTSNRVSLKPGDPWRDQIIRILRGCAAALVIATPESVNAPWVNFESGGAWVADKQVIPCCAGGMTKSSLPAPLSHLQAVELDDSDDLRRLVEFLASVAGLDSPTDVAYGELAKRLADSSTKASSVTLDRVFVAWIKATELRPNKFKGEAERGTLRVNTLDSVDWGEAGQFSSNEGIRAGDSLRASAYYSDHSWLTHVFVNGPDADVLTESQLPQEFEGDLVCLGQCKVFDTVVVMDFGDEGRGVSYPPAYVFRNLQRR